MTRRDRLRRRIRTHPWRQIRQMRNRNGRITMRQIRAAISDALADIPGPAIPPPPWAAGDRMTDIGRAFQERKSDQ